MSEDAQTVLRTLAFSEKQLSATEERWFTVRIMPYRTMEDVIAGLVITFTNITKTKALEAELRAENAALKTCLSRNSSARWLPPLQSEEYDLVSIWKLWRAQRQFSIWKRAD